MRDLPRDVDRNKIGPGRRPGFQVGVLAGVWLAASWLDSEDSGYSALES